VDLDAVSAEHLQGQPHELEVGMVWIERDDTDTSAEMNVSPEAFVLLGQGFDDRLILGLDAAYHRLRIDGSGRCDKRDVDLVLGQQTAERRQEAKGRMRCMNLDQGQGLAELQAIDGKLFGHIEDQPLPWPAVGKRPFRRPMRMPVCADDRADKLRVRTVCFTGSPKVKGCR